jgi:hypothetical protein
LIARSGSPKVSTRQRLTAGTGAALLAADSPIFVITKRERSLLDYCAGAGIGRMLDTRQTDGVSTSTMLIKNLVGCAGWPAAPMVNRTGT